MQSRETWIRVLRNLGACRHVLRLLRDDGVGFVYFCHRVGAAQLGAVLAAEGVICPPFVEPHERCHDQVVWADKTHDRVIWADKTYKIKLQHYPLWQHAHWYYPLSVLDDGIRVLAERGY